MPQIAPVQLATLLKKHLYNRKVRATAEEIGISYMVLYKFVRGTTPHSDNLDKIVAYMQNQGLISRLGLPVEPTEIDRTQLSSMGIEMVSKKSRYCCAHLSDRDFLIVVGGIMAASISQEENERLISTLFPSEFQFSA